MLTSTIIPIPEHIEVGKVIGREGRNLKPISTRTGTFISVNTHTNPAQIEIKYNPHCSPSNNQINEAKELLNNLIKNIEKEEKRNLRLLEGKKNREKNFLDDFDEKAVRGNPVISKYQKEIAVKKERQRSKKKISNTIKSYMKGGFEEGWELEMENN
ncbi:hypothetical protein RclHR1_00050021 [Rhizophagus clarus]|nr:hypothetical protein RclHR1_00050021 [Rhizophagus clarus]